MKKLFTSQLVIVRFDVQFDTLKVILKTIFQSNHWCKNLVYQPVTWLIQVNQI